MKTLKWKINNNKQEVVQSTRRDAWECMSCGAKWNVGDITTLRFPSCPVCYSQNFKRGAIL